MEKYFFPSRKSDAVFVMTLHILIVIVDECKNDFTHNKQQKAKKNICLGTV